MNLPSVIAERIRVVAKDDAEAGRSLLDRGLGKAGDLEEAAGEHGIAGGVEGGRRFGFVSGDGEAGVEIGAGAYGDFDVVKGALGFDDTAPAERGTGFGEGGDSAGKFAAVGAGFEGGDGVAVKNDAQGEVGD